MVEGILLFIILIIFSAYLFFREMQFNGERELWQKERASLLDRLMSRDWGEYKMPEFKVPSEEEPQEIEIDETLGETY